MIWLQFTIRLKNKKESRETATEARRMRQPVAAGHVADQALAVPEAAPAPRLWQITFHAPAGPSRQAHGLPVDLLSCLCATVSTNF